MEDSKNMKHTVANKKSEFFSNKKNEIIVPVDVSKLRKAFNEFLKQFNAVEEEVNSRCNLEYDESTYEHVDRLKDAIIDLEAVLSNFELFEMYALNPCWDSINED